MASSVLSSSLLPYPMQVIHFLVHHEHLPHVQFISIPMTYPRQILIRCIGLMMMAGMPQVYEPEGYASRAYQQSSNLDIESSLRAELGLKC